MVKKTNLVVMAAGMGSRFGGLKQIEPVGPNGEIIIDYSIYDAKKAGFDKAVFIIKKEIEKDFREVVGKRIEKKIDVDYAFQTMDNMPEGRNKPWGTGHAVLCAREAVDSSFAVINADDFYGFNAYKVINENLKTSNDYSMVGFMLENTLTENGTVARGVCEIENGILKSVTEHTAIDKNSGFPKDTIVSMNMWGFTKSIFDHLEVDFKEFLKERGTEMKSEFFLPSVVDRLIKSGKEKVTVLQSTDKWYGVTYKEDKESVQEMIKCLTKEGLYNGI